MLYLLDIRYSGTLRDSCSTYSESKLGPLSQEFLQYDSRITPVLHEIGTDLLPEEKSILQDSRNQITNESHFREKQKKRNNISEDFVPSCLGQGTS